MTSTQGLGSTVFFVTRVIQIQYLITRGTEPIDVHLVGAATFPRLCFAIQNAAGRLDSYDEAMMLNQFIWGLQPELARSVSLQYPKSIA